MSNIATAPTPFIAWLRRTRRSAWLLIGLCLVFRVGDAVLGDSTAADPSTPAMAAMSQ
ncbi:hypothetical protein [Sphingomonas pokkalii]|uniref:hypothetical protein n=1 Tax=Sphingomonas pokkalii TaxID=2175090 RepID=UPI0014035A80|nr:hypothetical protein [Sphingomonas pokkalii]